MGGATVDVVSSSQSQPRINLGFVRKPKEGILMAAEIVIGLILTLSGSFASSGDDDGHVAIPVVCGLFACIVCVTRLVWYGINLQRTCFKDFAAEAGRMELIYLSVCMLLTLVVTIVAAVTAPGSASLTVFGFFGVILFGLFSWDTYFRCNRSGTRKGAPSIKLDPLAVTNIRNQQMNT